MNFINLIDLYGYSMFDNIVYPQNLDKNVIINTIMDTCAMYTPIYTDINLLTMKINNFFLKYQNTFNKLYDAYSIEYNMIDNYDRTEQYTTTDVQNITDTAVYSSNTNQSGINSTLVSPDDSNNYVNDTRLESSDNSNLSSTNNVSNNSNNTRTHELHAYGNIGVTTSQQMLASELDIRPKLNIYEIIAKFFFREFFIYTY